MHAIVPATFAIILRQHACTALIVDLTTSLLAIDQSRQPCSVSRKRTGPGIAADQGSSLDIATYAVSHRANTDSFTLCSSCTEDTMTTLSAMQVISQCLLVLHTLH